MADPKDSSSPTRPADPKDSSPPTTAADPADSRVSSSPAITADPADPKDSSAPSAPSAPADLAVATRELRAARAIVLDPTCDDDLAAGHLVRAWQALARAAGRDVAEGAALLTPEDRAVMPPQAVEELPAVVPVILATRAAPPPIPWSLDHAALERHCDALAALLDVRHRPPRPDLPRAVLRRLAFGAGALLALVLAWRPWQSTTIGPWAATYYDRSDFTGQSVERRDRDVNFEWKDEPPMDTIPADRYSVRWDSCLSVGKAQDVAFQLVSDDGSRLFLDGEQIVDNWGKHELQARGATVRLRAGVHHLRVEYFEHRDAASVALSASFAGEKPGPIPAAMLSAPSGDDDDDPCAAD
jgi:hypothetical protein